LKWYIIIYWLSVQQLLNRLAFGSISTAYILTIILHHNWSKPHTSGSLVQSSHIRMTMKNPEHFHIWYLFKKFPYLVDTLVHVTKGNKHSLLTFLLFFIRSFVLQTITSELHLVSIFGCMVVHVMKNKWAKIANAPYLVVRSFMSWRINELRSFNKQPTQV